MIRVLVVDDQPGFRSLLMQQLQREGFEVAGAGDAHEAVNVASNFHPHVLVGDWMLEDGHSGVDLALALQAAGVQAKLILMSAYPKETVEAEARSAGAITLLTKPFELPQLVAAIQRALDEDRQGDQLGTLKVEQ